MPLIKILAFDPGTANTGYATLTGNTSTSEVHLAPYFGVQKTAKRDTNGNEISIRERIDCLGVGMRTLITALTPTHIAMEDFVEQGKFVGKTYKEMAYLTEHMRLVGREMGLEVTIYANGYWKKQTMKSSGTTKEQVQHFVSHKLPEAKALFIKQPNHVWDSAGIGYCKWLEILSEGGG